jgi:protein tyrosine phosphatase (PTP) superfamily phosphohydrolase (DUF442 family)
MKKRILLAGVLALSLSLGSALAASPFSRPGEWATPVSDAGIENLYRVETNLFRSAVPTSAGFQKLTQMGVKTVLDLRGGDGDKAAAGASLKLFHVPMSAWGLHNDRVLQALRIVADPQNRPLLIHCQHGADRTGAIVALYRVVVQGWSKERAIREMNEGGYHHNSFFRNLDQYVLAADVAALRKQLGIVEPLSPVGQTVLAGGSKDSPASSDGTPSEVRTVTTAAAASSNQ